MDCRIQFAGKTLNKFEASMFVCLFLSLFLAASTLVFGQKTLDFSGEWILDKSNSKLPEGAEDIKFLSKTVKQTGTSIEIKTRIKLVDEPKANVVMQQNTFPPESVEKYAFKNGTQAARRSSRKNPVIKTAEINPEEKSLKITTNFRIGAKAEASGYKTIAVWNLSDDKRVLIITERLNVPLGKTSSAEEKKWIFRKIN